MLEAENSRSTSAEKVQTTGHSEVRGPYKIPAFFAEQRGIDTAPAIVQATSPEERASMELSLARANGERLARLAMFDPDTSIH